MGILRIFKGLITKVPQVGESVWWAPKGVGCQVTSVEPNGNVIFQGGEIVTNSNGREMPRWTVAAKVDAFVFDQNLGMWVVGQGPRPKRVRETIVTPEAVVLSGKAKGSFAVKTGGK